MSTISWFEIPTSDIERAQKFYESIFGMNMMNMDNAAVKMRIFPVKDMMEDITGAIVYNQDFYSPSEKAGTLVYLNSNPNVQHVLDKVVSAGGQILVPKRQISDEFGYMALIIDTEGNRIGLHSVG